MATRLNGVWVSLSLLVDGSGPLIAQLSQQLDGRAGRSRLIGMQGAQVTDPERAHAQP